MGSTESKSFNKISHNLAGSEIPTEERKEGHDHKLVHEAKEVFHEGNVFFRESCYEHAKTKYADALEKLRDYDGNLKENHKSLALSNLGVLEFAEGRYEEAKRLLSEALDERRKIHMLHGDNEPPTPSVTALTLEMKRDIAFHRLPKEKMFLAAELKDHATVDAMTADLLNNLAACYEVAGEFNESKKLYEESLNLRKIIFGDRSLKAAESMQNLATILDSQGDFQESKKLLEESLLIEELIHGENHIDTAVSLNNLGVLCAHLGDLPRAEKLLERSVNIRVKTYGENHNLTKSSKQNLDYVVNKRKSCEEVAKDVSFAVGDNGKKDNQL